MDLLHEYGYRLYDCRKWGGEKRLPEEIVFVDPEGSYEVNVVGIPRRDGGAQGR